MGVSMAHLLNEERRNHEGCKVGARVQQPAGDRADEHAVARDRGVENRRLGTPVCGWAGTERSTRLRAEVAGLWEGDVESFREPDCIAHRSTKTRAASARALMEAAVKMTGLVHPCRTPWLSENRRVETAINTRIDPARSKVPWVLCFSCG